MSRTFKACPKNRWFGQNRWFGHDRQMRAFVRDCIKDCFAKGKTKEEYLASLKEDIRATAGEMWDYYLGREAQADAAFDIKPMPEPMKSMYLNALKETGDLHLAVQRIEESLNSPQYVRLMNFARWLKQWELSIGHGTVDLRWTEFSSKLRPMSQDQAYEFAMAAMVGA